MNILRLSKLKKIPFLEGRNKEHFVAFKIQRKKDQVISMASLLHKKKKKCAVSVSINVKMFQVSVIKVPFHFTE